MLARIFATAEALMRLDRSLASSLGWIALVLLGSTAMLSACSSSNKYDDDDDSSTSTVGAGSDCDSKHRCKSGLSCTAGVCVADGSGGSGAGGTSSIAPGTLGGSCDTAMSCTDGLRCYSGICIPDQTGTGGTTSVEQGALAGPCYPNNTCNAGLDCFSGYCLPPLGTGGTSAEGSGGDTSSSGGSTGGSPEGGSAGHGGSSSSSGGTTGGSSSSSGGTGPSSGGSSSATGGSSSSAGGTGGSSSGTGGGSGTGGSGGTPSTLIVTQDGFVAPGSNSVGIAGPWFTFKDTVSTISPLPNGVDFTGAGDQICVEGTISHSDDYGPTLGLNFNQPDTSLDPATYVASDHGVTGFSFTLEGTLPGTMQITFGSVDQTVNYCKFVTPGSSNSITISSAQLSCWQTGGANATSSMPFTSIQFQLPVNYAADGQTYQYCISNLRALTN
jgi:hypothetical protein